MTYRPEIDGLRALAVLSVILFHADLGGFSGGFVGVDVFFVISGYLITGLLIEDLDQKKLSLARFYERRARRILPALFFVILICAPIAMALLHPWQRQDFAASAFSTVLSLSNFYFLSQVNYFAPEADIQPLLHTWSLAVEEQYYLLFPVSLMLMWRFGRRSAFWIVLVLSVASLALAEYGWRENPGRNFFFTGSRLWEIGAGSLCALSLAGRLPRRRPGLAMTGLLLIVLSVVLFDRATPSPSLYILMPVIGTVLVIVFARPDAAATRILSFAPLVHIGLISYSAYLWHQPVLAFARQVMGPDLPFVVALVLVITSLGLGDLTWRWVEQPFRRRPDPWLPRRRSVFLASGVLSLLIAVPSAWLYFNHGHLRSLTAAEHHLLAYRDYPRDPVYRTGECLLLEQQRISELADTCGQDQPRLFLGDSHAAALFAGLPAEASIGRLTQGGCSPLFDFVAAQHPHCAETNAFVQARVLPRPVDAVYLHANWPMYASTDGFDAALTATIAQWRASGARVIVIGGVPQWQPSLPATMVYQRTPLQSGQRVVTDLDRQRAINARLSAIAAQAGVPFVDPIAVLCNPQDQCLAVVGEADAQPIAWDYGHLTQAGADFVVRHLAGAHPGLF